MDKILRTSYRIIAFVFIFILLLHTVLAENEKAKEDMTFIVDKTAFVNNSKAYFQQYPHELERGDTAQLIIKNKHSETDWIICFDFPIDTEYITLESIGKRRFYGLYNEDLKKPEKELDRICVNQFSNTDQVQIDYKMSYSGEGVVKYNVSLLPAKYNYDYSAAKANKELIILDPYLVGSPLATDAKLELHYAMNNTLTDISGNSIPATYHIIDDEAVGIWDFRMRQNSSNLANNLFNGSDENVVHTTDGVQIGGTTTSRVAVPSLNGQLDNLPAITLYSWIKFHPDNCSVADSRNNAGVLIGGFSGKTAILAITGCDNARFGLKSTLVDTNWSTSTGAGLNDNAWHMVLGTWGAGEYDNKMMLYIDGVNVANNSLGGLTDNEDNFYIGSNTGGEKQFVYNGTIRDTGYYNRTMSPEEVSALYINGNYSTGYDGSVNGSFKFNGDDVILFQNTSDLPINNENRSIGFFVNGTAPANNFAGLFCYGSTLETFCLTADTDGDLVIRFSGASSTDTNTNVLDNTWHHVGVVWNGTVAFVYLDGDESTTFTTALSTGNNYTGTIGTLPYNRSQSLTGEMSQVMLFSRALDENEMAVLAGGYNKSINFVFLDEILGTSILNVDLDVIADDFSKSFSTTTGNLSISGIPDEIITFRYTATNYTERFYFVNASAFNSTNLTLYLLNDSFSSNITFTAYSNVNELVENVYIRALRYDIDNNSYKVVAMAKTGTNGDAKMDLQKNTEFYKFMIYFPFNSLQQETNPQYILTDNFNFQVSTISDVGVNFDNNIGITHNLTFNNATDNFKFTYSDPNGLMHTAVLNVYRITAQAKELINQTTLTSTSGTLLAHVNVVNGTTYIANAIIEYSGEELIDSLTYVRDIPLPSGRAGLYIAWTMTMLFAFMGFFSLGVAVILTPLPNIFAAVMGFVPKDMLAINIVILVLGLIVATILGREG